MMLTDLSEFFFGARREEGRSSLHALLKQPSFIYAPSRAEEPQKLAKLALSSETWASYAIRARARRRRRFALARPGKA